MGPWERGDLAIEVAGPSLYVGSGDGSGDLLRLYAEKLGIALSSLMRNRCVATAWPPETRPRGVLWTVCQVLHTQPDRFELVDTGRIKTVAEATALVRERVANERGY